MEKTSTCPKCNYVSPDEEFTLCPKCGIIIKKYLEKKKKAEEEAKLKAAQEEIIREQRQQEETRRREQLLLEEVRRREQERREEDRSKQMHSWKNVGGLGAAIIGVLFLLGGLFTEPGEGSTINLHRLHIKQTLYTLGGVFFIISAINVGIEKILTALADIHTIIRDQKK